jgi:tryptophan 2,3-dioxygenase
MSTKKGTAARDPNKTKTGKPKLHSKTMVDLEQMLVAARPKHVNTINKAIVRKAGRGR